MLRKCVRNPLHLDRGAILICSERSCKAQQLGGIQDHYLAIKLSEKEGFAKNVARV